MADDFREDMHYLENGRGKLITHHEAPSKSWDTMRYVEDVDEMGQRFESWENTWYYCAVRRYDRGFFLKNSPYIVISISNKDDTAAHDWRDFQRIKNDIAGRDWEGAELYPAESRLKDPSNRFYLWCVPPKLLKFGIPGGRRVWDIDQALGPQRPFPKRP